jgi:uncharacterized protein (PEP-CTERM system associated)
MATMPRKRSRAEGAARRALVLDQSQGSGSAAAGFVRTAIVASLTIVAPAWAQRVDVEPAVSARVTATDNAGLGFSTGGRDLITEIIAGVHVRREGARLRLDGTVSLDSFLYARHTQGNDIVPRIDLAGRLIAVERFLFVEAAIRTSQNHIDPFGPDLTSTTTANNTTSVQYSLSPYIESEPAANLHFRARSDNVLTKDYGDSSPTIDAVDGSYFGRHTISLERDPVPFGWRLEGERNVTRYQGQFEPLQDDVVRALGNLAVFDTATVGLRVGAERLNFLTDSEWQSIYGGQFTWRPSERTSLTFDREHRFFGNAMHLTFTHRMPFLAWDLHASRDLDTTPSTLFNLPPTNNVSALLDSILTTRFPNPADRASQVQNIISRQGLPPATAIQIAILAPRLSVTETVSAGVAYLGPRNTLALNVFGSRSRDALEEGPLATGNPTTNNAQRGAALTYAFRMTPTATAGLTASGSYIKSLSTATVSESTREAALSAQLVVQLAPKTTAQFGAEQRRLHSNIATSGHETSVFAGLDHRF